MSYFSLTVCVFPMHKISQACSLHRLMDQYFLASHQNHNNKGLKTSTNTILKLATGRKYTAEFKHEPFSKCQ